MTRGILFGSFLPPHRGHLMLCKFAQAYCDRLTILVSAHDNDPIAGAVRVQWMRELVPDAQIVLLDRDLPQSPADSPDFWMHWRAAIQSAHPEPIDYLFTSESDGGLLAQTLAAQYVPFDPGRHAAPISGAQVRNNPYLYWDYLPAPVRAHYVKTVCLFGPESTGKSTLAPRLAAQYQTIAIPEYGRTYCEIFGTHCTADDLRAIAKGQKALEAAAKREANRLLVIDTDRLMTALWADMLLGVRPPDLDAVDELADLYLLADIDMPWADDGTRYFPGDAARQRFYRICREELEKRNLPFETISGDRDQRLKMAVDAINRHFPELGDL